MKKVLLLLALSAGLALPAVPAAAGTVPQICGYCDGGGPQCWIRDPFTGQYVHC